jgi:hypothetical protein
MAQQYNAEQSYPVRARSIFPEACLLIYQMKVNLVIDSFQDDPTEHLS